MELQVLGSVRIGILVGNCSEGSTGASAVARTFDGGPDNLDDPVPELTLAPGSSAHLPCRSVSVARTVSIPL